MLKKIAVVLSTFAFAFAVLAVSVLRSCNADSFKIRAATPIPNRVLGVNPQEEIEIEYVFVYPGSILPDSPFWFLKALRDKAWLAATTNEMRKAELSLLFADKRLVASHQLFKDNKPQLALTVLTKAEKYMQNAAQIEKDEREEGVDSKSFLLTLNRASLAHMGKIKEILALAPDDIKPEIIKTENYANEVYRQSRDALQSCGAEVAKNPFAKD